MAASHYLLLLIVWMWWLGCVILFLFMDKLTHRDNWRWWDVVLCVLWPISLPALLAFYVAFGTKQDS